jgi:HEAT repeat protein
VAKRRRLEDDLAAIRAARDKPNAPGSIAAVRSVLESASNFAVAAAAELVGDFELSELAPVMRRAFERFMIDPLTTDRGCRAKIAIAVALHQCRCDDVELFLRGMRHVQREPAYSETRDVDTAAELRGACALGLAQSGHPFAVVEIARSLADPERVTRVNAARAIGAAGGTDGIPLLRYKALVGDEDPQVTTECLVSLLALAPAESLELVKEFLVRDDETGEAAVVALGHSRLERALPMLVEWTEKQTSRERRVGLMAIAMLRTHAAMDYLCGRIEGNEPELGAQAIAAIAMHKYDPRVKERVAEIVAASKQRRLRDAFAKAFD